jgi:homoserine kinase
MTFAGRSVVVKVPATTANLGPGFDTLGLALSLYDELTVTVRDEPGVFVEVIGVGAGVVPTDETNLVVTAIAHTFAAYDIEMPGLNLVARNSIAHGRGMGSSGAAIVSGIMAAKGLLEGIVEIDSRALLALATQMEGHPDNVAPALFGGLTIAWMTPEGPQHKKLMVHRGVSPLVFVPESTMSTALARSLQPASVPHEDAIFNVSRSALLIACRRRTHSSGCCARTASPPWFPVRDRRCSCSAVTPRSALWQPNLWPRTPPLRGSRSCSPSTSKVLLL